MSNIEIKNNNALTRDKRVSFRGENDNETKNKTNNKTNNKTTPKNEEFWIECCRKNQRNPKWKKIDTRLLDSSYNFSKNIKEKIIIGFRERINTVYKNDRRHLDKAFTDYNFKSELIIDDSLQDIIKTRFNGIYFEDDKNTFYKIDIMVIKIKNEEELKKNTELNKCMKEGIAVRACIDKKLIVNYKFDKIKKKIININNINNTETVTDKVNKEMNNQLTNKIEILKNEIKSYKTQFKNMEEQYRNLLEEKEEKWDVKYKILLKEEKEKEEKIKELLEKNKLSMLYSDSEKILDFIKKYDLDIKSIYKKDEILSVINIQKRLKNKFSDKVKDLCKFMNEQCANHFIKIYEDVFIQYNFEFFLLLRNDYDKRWSKDQLISLKKTTEVDEDEDEVDEYKEGDKEGDDDNN